MRVKVDVEILRGHCAIQFTTKRLDSLVSLVFPDAIIIHFPVRNFA